MNVRGGKKNGKEGLDLNGGFSCTLPYLTYVRTYVWKELLSFFKWRAGLVWAGNMDGKGGGMDILFVYC